MISKVAIRNYRMLRAFDIDLHPGLNIVVGQNEAGKSTLIEAINLALTGRLHGRFLSQEMSPYLINLDATAEYIASLAENPLTLPPTLIIDVFLSDTEDAEILRGTNNLHNENACGVRLQAGLSPDFVEEYKAFAADAGGVHLAPTEYYRVDWLGFSGNAVTARSVPTAVSVIDPTTIRMQTGVDQHLQQVIRTHLDPKERVELSRQYRSLREEFADRPAVKAVNDRLKDEGSELTDRDLSLGVDISQRYTWESSLVAHLDEVPFPYIGRGEQNALKILLAIGQKADQANVILIEEPENHLSFTSLRRLVARIEAQGAGRQVIVTTHSTYVLNKLGLENLVLIGGGACARITDLPPATAAYFKKLAGFDTLRLVLADAAILVEGPSDELIVQRGYADAKGHPPIEDGIDVISVGLSHKRFLDIAVRLGRRVWVVTDNDGKTVDEVKARFANYLGSEFVSVHTGADPSVRTLEPQIVEANELATLNAALGLECASKAEVLDAMLADKTAAALALFETELPIVTPEYMRDVWS